MWTMDGVSKVLKKRFMQVVAGVVLLGVVAALQCVEMRPAWAADAATVGKSSVTKSEAAKGDVAAPPDGKTLAQLRASLVGVEVPQENGDCTACHKNEGAAAQDEAFLGFDHAGLLCVSCHDDGEVLDDLHAKTKAKRMPMRMKKTAVENETCSQCHEIEGDEFVGLSADVLLSDANGLEVNAHEVVAAEQHQGIACVACHEFHDDTLPAEQAQKVCATCHHANVYECFTCHEHA